MTNAPLDDTAAELRASLLERDAATLRLQTRAILAILRRLDASIRALVDEVAARAAAGLPVSRGALTQLEEFRRLRDEALVELRQYAADAAETIEAAQRRNFEAGATDARLLVDAQLRPVRGWAVFATLGVEWNALDTDALSILAGRLGDGSPLRAYVAARIVRGTIADVVGTLVGGIQDNPRVTARKIRQNFAGGMTQSLRISRTETLRAYRDAARATYEANPRIVRAYRRHAALDARTCAACWLLDGTLYANSSDMEEHIQGRCYLTPELNWGPLGGEPPSGPAPRYGRDIFVELPLDRQRAIIGNDRQFDAYAAGRLGLPDLIQRTTHPDFGAQLTQSSAIQAMSGRGGTLTALPSTDEITPIERLVRPTFGP